MYYLVTLALDLYPELGFFFLLSTCGDEIIPTTNIVTLLPNPLPSDSKKISCESNPISYPECLYLSKLAFLVNLTIPNKKFLNLKSALF